MKCLRPAADGAADADFHVDSYVNPHPSPKQINAFKDIPCVAIPSRKALPVQRFTVHHGGCRTVGGHAATAFGG